jgi:hypothetical protein
LVTGGSVGERYTYDAYGNATIYNADFSSTRSTSSHDNPIRFGGYWRDRPVSIEPRGVRRGGAFSPARRWGSADASARAV